MHQFISKLLSAGVSFHSRSLDILRQRTINIFSLAFISVMTISMILRLSGGEYYVMTITLLSLIIISFSFNFSFNNKLDYAIATNCIVPISLILMIAVRKNLSCVNLVAPLIMVIVVFSIIIRSEKMRWGFLISSILMLTWISIRYENSNLYTGSLAIQVLGMGIGFIYFVRYLEAQDTDLQSALQNEIILNTKLSTKNDDLKTFAHIMTHDLKTPIRNIKGFTQLIKRKSKGFDDKMNEYFSFIEKSSINMESLINDLLKYQEIDQESAQFEKVNLNNIIDEIKEIEARDISARKSKIIYDKLPSIYGNESFLKILFSNLISNSLKYQPLNLDDHIPKVQINADKSQEFLTVNIEDNGIGISEDYMENIFEPFTRFHNSSEYSGTGLGLSICKKIMHKHNGNIRIVKSDHTGTIFKLEFPI